MKKNELDHGAVRAQVKAMEDYFKMLDLDYRIEVSFSRDIGRYGVEGGEQESNNWDASWC